MKLIPRNRIQNKLYKFGNGGFAPLQSVSQIITRGMASGMNSEWSPSKMILNQIKKFEGFRPNWYLDGNGNYTIGYGSKDTKDGSLRKQYSKGMTEAQASAYFEKSVNDRIARFIQLTPNFDLLNNNQRDALFSYYYNVGEGTYSTKSPKMQKALRDKNWEEVARQMDAGYNDSNNPGLRTRRDWERQLFLTPV